VLEDKPTIEAIEGTQTDDSAVLFQAYQSDELDFIGIAPEDEEAVENDPDLQAQAVEVPGSCSFYLGFNTTRPPFNDVKVRQAFAQGFDREAWVRDILQGHGIPAYSFIPPGIPGHDPELKMWEFDAAKAKAALQATTYDFDQELQLTYASTPRNKARFEWIAAQPQNNLGVKVRLDPVEPTAYTALLKEEADKLPLIFSLGWCADYPDPQNYLSLVFGEGGIGAGRTGWKNQEFLDLTQRADKMPVDSPERAQLYKQAQEILVSDAPVVHTSFEAGEVLIKPWMVGLRESLTPLDYFPGIFNLSGWSIKTE
jgi:oligopeptide transport system substrate-binding protein